MFATLSLALLDNPPQPVIPTLTDGLIGWMLGLAVLVGPLALVTLSWRRRHGQWWSCLTQWNTAAFWMVVLGTLVAAVGIMSLIGIIPAWQTHWNAWYIGVLTSNTGADPATLKWLQTFQSQYAFALQICAASVFLLGAASVVIGQMRLAHRITDFRPAGPDDWLVAPGANEAPTSSQAGRRMTHPISARM